MEQASTNNMRRGRWIGRVVDLRALALFSVLFAITVCAMYGALFLSGRTLIRVTDGLDQHYPFFLYIGKWIRSSVKDLLTGRGLPAVWNMNFGYGSDMVTTLGAYLPDPFNWLSALIPSKFSEAGFVGTVILRLWCSGSSFLVYCRHKGYETRASVVGALLYATCGVTLIAPVESFFVNPMITFPLVMMGMEIVMDGGRPTLFICSVAATFVLYFYFGYMTCILLVPAFVGAAVSRGWDFLRALRGFAAFVGYSVVAIALAGVVLLPIVLVVAQTGRIGIERPLDLLYSPDYYKRLLAGFSSSTYVGPDCYFGFGAVGALSVVLLLLRKGNASKKVTIGAYTLFLLVPFFGKMLNGFAYVTNRWTWAYAFVVAVCTVVCLPQALELGRRRRIVLYAVGIAYVVFLTFVSDVWAGEKQMHQPYLISAVALLAVLAALAILCRRSSSERILNIWYAVCCVAVIACSGATASFEFLDSSMPQLQAGTALRKMTVLSPYSILFRTSGYDRDASDCRVENMVKGPCSQALVNRVNSYDYYISLYNNRVDEFHSMLGVRETQTNVRYRNLDRRGGLEFAIGSGYMLDDGKHPLSIPLGYEELVREGEVRVLRTDAYRPIASLCDRVVSREDFDAASMSEREMLLTRAVVTDDGVNVTSGDLLSDGCVAREEFRVVGASNANVEGKTVTVSKKNGYLDVRFAAGYARTYYAELVGCSFAPVNDGESRLITFSAQEGSIITNQGLLSPRNHMSGGKSDWVANLGTFSAGEQVVRVTFSHPGTYRFADVRLVSLDATSALREHERYVASGDKVAMRYGKNEIACSVSAGKDEMLLVTTPWSSGWSATVDGVPAEVLVADVAFMGIRVPAGEHEVVLRYHTPGLLAGAFITLCGAAATVFLARRKGAASAACEGDDERI